MGLYLIGYIFIWSFYVIQKRNAKLHLFPTIGLIQNLILSWTTSWAKIHLLFALSKSQSILTLNIRGESHDKGLPEDAIIKASKGLYTLWGFF